MTTLVINDLVTDKNLDQKEMTRKQMARVSGGSFASARQPIPTFPVDSSIPIQAEGITILGEDKYGGWGGEW